MKQLIASLSFILICCLGACSSDRDSNRTKIIDGLQLVVMDKCEYVIYIDVRYGSNSITHHAACHNPVHSNNLIIKPSDTILSSNYYAK
jgi:hypothetical protein